MRPLRVLASAFVCCPPGKPGFTGGESLLGWQLVHQIARFNETWVLTNAEDRQSLEEGLAEREAANISFHYVGLPSQLRPLLRFQGGHQLYYYLWQIKAYFAARKLNRKVEFDLFHHVTYANDWMVSFTGALLPLPYIRGPGGGTHRTPRGLISEYTFGGRIWERVRAVAQWLFRHDPLYLKGQGRAKALLLCNQESISSVPKRWTNKVHSFPVNGISAQNLPDREPTRTPGKFRVLSAGSLIKVKGFGLAIKAFRGLAADHPDSEMLIIGSGPELPKLVNLVEKLQLEEKVRFVGAIPQDRLFQEMAEADVFLFPSLRDGGGSVVIEAMAMGKPVICLDTGGPAMHVDCKLGIKVTPSSVSQTVDDLEEGLKRLYLDPVLRRKLGEAAETYARNTYEWDSLGTRLMEIYELCLEN